MFKFVLGFIPSVISTFSNLKNFNEIYKNLQQQQKNVSLFHLGGHWVRLKVGGQPFIIRRKTLNRYSESILADIAKDDKISSKMISEILSKPFESMGRDDSNQQPNNSKDSNNNNNNSNNNNNNTNNISSSASYYDNNRKLPVKNTYNKYQQFKLNQEYQEEFDKSQSNIYQNDQQQHQDQSNRNSYNSENEKKKKEQNHHYFEEVENEKGEKKIKFEKDHDGYYLIDRDPVYFNYILNYLRTGNIQVPSSLEINSFIADSKFYRLTELEMILNDKIANDKRDLERQEVYKNEFSLHKINENTHGQNGLYFILPMEWFVQWKRFIDGGNYPPKTINTTVFFKSIDGYPINSLKDNLVPDSDYICISKETWLVFNKYYKIVGPIIIRTSKNIYDNPPEMFISSKIWNVK